MRDRMIIELARNGYIVTEQDGEKVVYHSMKTLYEEEFCLVADSLKSCGKIEVELNIIEIDEEETDELVEEETDVPVDGFMDVPAKEDKYESIKNKL